MNTDERWVADCEEGQWGVFEPTTGEEIATLPMVRPSWDPPRELAKRTAERARLLAAAPRLLKALGKFADSTIYGVLSDAGRAGDFRPLFDEMRAALEEACEVGAWREPERASSGGSTAPADETDAKVGELMFAVRP